jgi:iron-sulfur cluster repair protein YtfE (RIC family)
MVVIASERSSLVSALTQLSEEHRVLLPVISRIQEMAEAGDKVALHALVMAARAALKEELDAHMVLEEEVAFPTIAGAIGVEILFPFQEEHREIRALRDELLAETASGRVSSLLCLVLCDLLTSHIWREERMLFPCAHAAFDQVGSRASG